VEKGKSRIDLASFPAFPQRKTCWKKASFTQFFVFLAWWKENLVKNRIFEAK
jgi:hypothetical protein